MKKVVIDVQKDKKYIVDKDFETHVGKVPIRKNGRIIINGYKYIVLSPEFVDYWDTKVRGPQAMVKKDIGIIITYTGIASGWKVADLGCGGGSLLMYLANLVKPDGKVFAYDKEEKWIKIAKENIKRAGLEKYVEFKIRDLYKESIDENELDLIVIDVQEPWKVIEKVYDKVKIGKFIVCFVIHMEKIRKVYDTLINYGYDHIQIIETIERKIKITNNGTRPEISGILHTGYIIVGRRVE